jgi:four helix bundle protein
MQHATCNTQHATDTSPGGRRSYDLGDRLLDDGVRIIRLTEALSRSRAGNLTADRLSRSGASLLSNHGEAQAAESPDGFVHKLSIALKELKEARRCPRLIVKAKLIKMPDLIEPLFGETDDLIRIFGASIRTSLE